MVPFSFSKKDLYSSFGGHFFSRFNMNVMTSLEASASTSATVVALLWLPLTVEPEPELVGPAEGLGPAAGVMELPPVVSLKELPLPPAAAAVEPEELLAGLPLGLPEGLLEGLPLGLPKLELEPVVSLNEVPLPKLELPLPELLLLPVLLSFPLVESPPEEELVVVLCTIVFVIRVITVSHFKIPSLISFCCSAVSFMVSSLSSFLRPLIILAATDFIHLKQKRIWPGGGFQLWPSCPDRNLFGLSLLLGKHTWRML